MSYSQDYYEELEQLLRSSLDELRSNLTAQEVADVEEYVEHSEYGVAYELLTYVIEQKSLLSPENLRIAGERMGFLNKQA